MLDSRCDQLRTTLALTVKGNLSDAILLSGGLDSSIIAGIAATYTKLTGITAAYGDAPDLEFAEKIARKFGISCIIKNLDDEETKEIIHEVIRIMKTFDPMEIRNSTVIYACLKELKQKGFDSVMTGDGGDELFAGYSYMRRFDAAQLELELKRLWHIMRFSSVTMGKELSITVKTPYLDSEFLKLAKEIPVGLKVRENNGLRYGKWVLRACFEDIVTKEIAWRNKVPLEEGAGIDEFAKSFQNSIDIRQFEDEAKYYLLKDSVKIRDNEHLYYYTIFSKLFGPPRNAVCESRCPECQGCLDLGVTFCKICGAYPVKAIPDRSY